MTKFVIDINVLIKDRIKGLYLLLGILYKCHSLLLDNELESAYNGEYKILCRDKYYSKVIEELFKRNKIEVRK